MSYLVRGSSSFLSGTGGISASGDCTLESGGEIGNSGRSSRNFDIVRLGTLDDDRIGVYPICGPCPPLCIESRDALENDEGAESCFCFFAPRILKNDVQDWGAFGGVVGVCRELRLEEILLSLVGSGIGIGCDAAGSGLVRSIIWEILDAPRAWPRTRGDEVGEIFARPTVPTMAVSMTGSWSSEVGVKFSVRRLALRWKVGGCMLVPESCLNASAGLFPLPLSDPTDPFLLLEVTTAEVPNPSPTISLPRIPRSMLAGGGVPSRAAKASSAVCFSCRLANLLSILILSTICFFSLLFLSLSMSSRNSPALKSSARSSTRLLAINVSFGSDMRSDTLLLLESEPSEPNPLAPGT